MGGGGDEALDAPDHDVPPTEISRYPLLDVTNAMALCLQRHDIEAMSMKTRRSQGDLDLKHLDDTYETLLAQSFAL
eukprot:11358562-Alexandrium_andersonii.AAC.1